MSRHEAPSDEGPEMPLGGDLSHAAPETLSGTSEAEIVDPGPGSGQTAPDSGLIPVLRFTMPTDHRWHPGTEFGIAADGRLLALWDGGWRTSAYDDGESGDEAGVVRSALRQAMAEVGRLRGSCTPRMENYDCGRIGARLRERSRGLSASASAAGGGLPEYALHLEEQRGELADALEALVRRYNARGEFISCVTPPHRGPHATKADRVAAAKSEVWAEWDAALEALRKAGR